MFLPVGATYLRPLWRLVKALPKNAPRPLTYTALVSILDLMHIGYMKVVHRPNSGYRASPQHTHGFYDPTSAHVAYDAAQRMAKRDGGKVVVYWTGACSPGLRALFYGVDEVGQGIGSWFGENREDEEVVQ